MKIFLTPVKNSIPAVRDFYWNGRIIPVNVWIVEE